MPFRKKLLLTAHLKHISVIAIFILYSIFIKAQSLGSDDMFLFKSLYRYAIQEDVKTLLSILDTLPESRLTENELAIKKQYFARFTTGKEVFAYQTDDTLIQNIIDIYRNYWSAVLLKKDDIMHADTVLKQQLSAYLIKHDAFRNNRSEKSLRDDPMQYFSELLTEKGYYHNVDGKTGNLYDIYIWQTQDTVNYSVNLPEDSIRVPVLFMKDIITLGWEEYATFGVQYPGGWPGDSVLFCVAKAYDTTQENFLVSYLAHEAQHFSDLENYQEMVSWQLEYRAKLSEISLADATMDKLLSNFIRGSKNDSTLSHPYAEYSVINNLSQQIFNEDFITDMEKWRSLSPDDIHAAAILLMKQSSRSLKKK